MDDRDLLTKCRQALDTGTSSVTHGPDRAAGLLGLLERFPRLSETAKRLVAQWAVPFNRQLGIKVISVAPNSSLVVLCLPERRRNQNIARTVHGAALFALAETVHGVAVLWQFPPSMHRMYTKEASIEFLATARGDLQVSFGLANRIRHDIESALRSRGRSEVTLHASVHGRDGNEVARLRATYVILRRDSTVKRHAIDRKEHPTAYDSSAFRETIPVDKERQR